MKLEEQITKAVRITVLVCCGAILAFGTVFLLAERTMLFLDFSAAAAREGAFGSLVAMAIVALVVGILVLVPKDYGGSQPQPAEPVWKHTRGLVATMHRWYELHRVDAAGRHYSSMPEGLFTGVVRTNTNALLYIEAESLPRETVAWLIPDEDKFVSVTDTSFPRATRNVFYLLDTTNGRVCCMRDSSIGWRTVDGRSKHYLDDDKKVVRWLRLPEPEEDPTLETVRKVGEIVRG